MDWLNYHHLRYFWVVAREGGLARAAARLRVSQPSISAQIRELEQALGEKLFRREGRRNVPTDVGQLVLSYADEIFLLGEELLSNVKGRAPGRILRLHVGVVDSFPKLVTNQILDPVFGMDQAVHVICREGKLEDLLAQLATHRLDVVLADEPAVGLLNARTFTHRLGNSPISICAAPTLARSLRRGFPKSLHDAPALLPATNTSARRSLEKWFQAMRLKPRVLAEFEDLALMKAMAADGKGFIALPAAALAEAKGHYGFEPVGRAGNCQEQYYAITAERRIEHPAVAEITQRARHAFRA
jgi:LysR family transcriptional activator of nhaA